MKTFDNHPSPALWNVLDESLHADCKIYSIFKRHCQHPVNQKEGDFYVIKTSDWTQAIPLTSNDELILVNQYRFASEALSWEFPGGALDADETPIAAAARELKEETGFIGKNPKIIGSCRPNPAIIDNHAYFVLIEACEFKESTQWDHHEELQIAAVPVEDVFKMAVEEKISHALSLNALFFLKLYLNNR